MTQPINTRTSSQRFWQRLMLVPGFMGGLSLLSSTLVLAQPEASPDVVIVPRSKDLRAKEAATLEQSSSDKPHSTSTASWRERTNSDTDTLGSSRQQRVKSEVADDGPVSTRQRVKSEVADDGPVSTRQRTRPEVSDTPVPIRQHHVSPEFSESSAATREQRGKSEASSSSESNLVIDRIPSDVGPSRNSGRQAVHERSSLQHASAATNTSTDSSNAYIDPTPYNAGATSGYEAPSRVVLSERSTGCKAVLNQGQSVSGSLCGADAVPHSVAQRSESSERSWSPRTATQRLEEDSSASFLNSTPQAATWEKRVRSIALAGIPEASRGSVGGGQQEYSTPGRTNSLYYQGQLPENVGSSPNFTGAYNPILPPPELPGSANTQLLFPLSVPAPITSIFGWRVHPITGDRRFHTGTDLGAPMGTPVLAAMPGNVAVADYLGGYGLAVVLNHNQDTEQTLYGHLSQVYVQPGQWVEQGTVIGRVGSTGNATGPHLHFEIRHLTPEGWVAIDPGTQIQYALAQLVQVLQITQTPQQTAQLPQAQAIPLPQTVQIPQAQAIPLPQTVQIPQAIQTPHLIQIPEPIQIPQTPQSPKTAQGPQESVKGG